MKTSKLSRIIGMLAPIGAVGLCNTGYGQNESTASELACRSLVRHPALSITFAEVEPRFDSAPSYCYAIGTIPPGIRFHLELPYTISMQ